MVDRKPGTRKVGKDTDLRMFYEDKREQGFLL